MKTSFLLCAFVSIIYAKPNGVYHEEYQYKSSSQSFRNNELQHQNEDEKFYSKDGDLEGRQRPKVQAHEQHSEYVNPKLQYGSIGSQYDSSMGSHGMSSLASIYDKQNLVSSGYGAAGSADYTGTGHYTTGGLYTYGTGSNMFSQLGQRVQQDISRQLQEAIRNQYRQSSAYTINSGTMQSDIRILEEELKRNLTAQLQDALRTQAGRSYTYSMGGGTSPTSSYNSREFDELRRQLEGDLVRQLNDEVRNVYTTSGRFSSTYQSTGGTITHVPRPMPIPLNNGPYHSNSNMNSISSQTTHVGYRQYTPIPNPSSITVIASQIQNDLNNYLNTILHETQSKYLSGTTSYFTTSDLDNYIEIVKRQLQNNITTLFNEEMRRNYGSEVIKNGYSYSVASDGTHSPSYNYKVSDLNDLKIQVEQHLMSKIQRDFQSIRQQLVQRAYSTMQTSTYRPVIYRPSGSGGLITTNMYGHAGTSTGLTGSQINSYEWSDLQRQLQHEMSRQIQEALRQQQYKQASAYTASSTFNPNENYDIALQQLSEELKRNLTQRLQQSLQEKYSRSSSSSSGYAYGMSSGGSYSPHSEQIADLQSQLQNDLMRQLRQGLQQSYSKYSSFSASSSSSNYGYASGSQVMSDDPYDCMMGDDPSHQSTHRLKRSLEHKKIHHPLTFNHHSHTSNNQRHIKKLVNNNKFHPNRRDNHLENKIPVSSGQLIK